MIQNISIAKVLGAIEIVMPVAYTKTYYDRQMTPLG